MGHGLSSDALLATPDSYQIDPGSVVKITVANSWATVSQDSYRAR
jgi:hypothetical protein